jgi:hypothetical protein
LNGSPKGEISVTMQYMKYIEKKFTKDEFEVTRNYLKDFKKAPGNVALKGGCMSLKRILAYSFIINTLACVIIGIILTVFEFISEVPPLIEDGGFLVNTPTGASLPRL